MSGRPTSPSNRFQTRQAELLPNEVARPSSGSTIKYTVTPLMRSGAMPGGVTEAIIGEMKEEVSAHGARFVVVTASNAIQVHPDPAYRGKFSESIGVPDLFYPDRRIADFCTSRSIPVITLAPALAERASRDDQFLHGFDRTLGSGHWNQTGHRVAGELLGEGLCLEFAQ